LRLAQKLRDGALATFSIGRGRVPRCESTATCQRVRSYGFRALLIDSFVRPRECNFLLARCRPASRDDAATESTESVIATLSASAYTVGASASATVTIADNDVPPTAPSNLTARAASRSQIDLA
jgi:hypothetical protein